MKKRCALPAVSFVTVFIGIPTTTPPIAWNSMHAAGAPSAWLLEVDSFVKKIVLLFSLRDYLYGELFDQT